VKKLTHPIGYNTNEYYFEKLKARGKRYDLSPHQMARVLMEASLEESQEEIKEGITLLAVKLTELEQKIDKQGEDTRAEILDFRENLTEVLINIVSKK